MSDVVYERAADVVWRLGPDRVLARRVGTAIEEASADLTGAAALVWAALDHPGSSEEVMCRIGAADLGVPPTGRLIISALSRMLEAGLIAAATDPIPTG